MKKIIIVTVLCLFSASFAYSVTTPTDDDYQSLDQTRAKLVRLKREMDKFMKDLVATYPDQDVIGSTGYGLDVRVDVTENKDDFTVKADLPGMDKDKINVILEKGKVLKISGTREIVKKETSPGVVRQERVQGSFSRVVELPSECKSDGIAASYQNGVLEIKIPKKEPTKEEMIKVKVQ